MCLGLHIRFVKLSPKGSWFLRIFLYIAYVSSYFIFLQIVWILGISRSPEFFKPEPMHKFIIPMIFLVSCKPKEGTVPIEYSSVEQLVSIIEAYGFIFIIVLIYGIFQIASELKKIRTIHKRNSTYMKILIDELRYKKYYDFKKGINGTDPTKEH